jgi:hypothetical protein
MSVGASALKDDTDSDTDPDGWIGSPRCAGQAKATASRRGRLQFSNGYLEPAMGQYPERGKCASINIDGVTLQGITVERYFRNKHQSARAITSFGDEYD